MSKLQKSSDPNINLRKGLPSVQCQRKPQNSDILNSTHPTIWAVFQAKFRPEHACVLYSTKYFSSIFVAIY